MAIELHHLQPSHDDELSRLKARHAFDVYDEYTNTGDDEKAQVYLKSEVDKVIAELRAQIVQADACCDKALKGKLVEHATFREWAELQLRYQKYKRCLAMARWCDEVMMSCELRGYTVHRIWANKHEWSMRWKYRWLELAEKFKDKEA